MKLLKRILAAIRGKSQESDCCEVCFTGTVPTFGEEKFIIRNNNFAEEFPWKLPYCFNQCTGITIRNNNFEEFSWKLPYCYNQCTGITTGPAPALSPKDDFIAKLMISDYAKRLHRVDLKKDGNRFVGIYGELSSWGLVFDAQGIEHEKLYKGWDEGGRQLSNFVPSSFTDLGGYEIV